MNNSNYDNLRKNENASHQKYLQEIGGSGVK